MDFVHEVTAHLENKPGRLAKICSALAHEKVNIRAMSVMDAGARSVLRLVIDEKEPTGRILTSLGTEHTWEDVLGLEVDHKTGSLAKILEHLAEEHINVEYAYVSAVGASGRSLAVFHTSNPKRAIHVLGEQANPSGSSDKDSGRRPLHAR